MKKSVIAAALASVVSTGAFAQNVTLSGVLDTAFQSNDYKGAKVTGLSNNGSATSTIQLSGSEDLGGGLKANFKLNSDINPSSNLANAGYGGVATVQAAGTTSTSGVAGGAGSWLNSEMKVGVSGGFGSIDGGVLNNLALAAGGTGQPFGTAIGSGYRALYNTDVIGLLGSSGTAGSAPRFDHTLRYTSPTISGFSFAVSTVTKNTKASSDAFSTTLGNYDRYGVQEASISYSEGPLNVFYANQKQKGQDLSQLNAAAAVLVNTDLNTLGANYKFGQFTAYGLYQTTKANTTTTTSRDAEYYSASLKYTMGVFDLMGQYGVYTNNLNNTDRNSTMLGLGADYNLSKRTALFVRYEDIADKANVVANPTKLTAVEATGNRIRSAIGLRHTF